MPEIRVDVRDPSCPNKEIRIDVCGENCPVPLVETRKALRKAAEGDIVTVIGTHAASKEEIPMAAQALGLEILDIQETEGVWTIRIQR
ncbi:MAG: sulfurtransferase TusA family protein [Anaerolineae bacterium]|nr:sulfurtransferase TusA family protein [Anaerolineae bacterium]